MAEWNELELQTECDCFCQYLVDRRATPDILAAYLAGHRSLPVPIEAPIDRLLLRWARNGDWRLRLADTYARLARPLSLVRMKMALAIAVLESSRTTHRVMNSGAKRLRVRKGRGWSRLLGLGPGLAVMVGWTVLSITILSPIHLLIAVSGKSRG
jgi:hypothetical protein